MRELIIRKAIKDDAEKIIEYLNLIGGESENLLFGENEFNMPIESERSFIESMNNSDRNILLVGLVNKEIVSIASLQGYERERIAHRGNMGVSVKKKYWHKGIATKMINELIKFAKSANITVIELEVKSENTNAIDLYEKMGFEKIGVYKNFVKINDKYYDNYLMNLYLD